MASAPRRSSTAPPAAAAKASSRCRVNNRNGKLVASFPVEDSDQIMLVTDKGQLIRCPVEGIRIAGRSTQGVIVFDTAEDEHVVSVEHIGEEARTATARRVSSELRHRLMALPETKKAAGGIPTASSIQEQPGRLKFGAALWGAVGGDQPGFPDHVLVPAARRQDASKFGQACCEQSRPTCGCRAGRPWRALRHAGFDLRGKAGKNGQGGGDERGKSDCGKSLDHDGPLSWAVAARRFVGGCVTSAAFPDCLRQAENGFVRPEFCFVAVGGRNIAVPPSRRAGPESGSLADGVK